MARNPEVYSVQIYADSFSAGGSAALTPPSGFKWVVRDISGVVSVDPAAGGQFTAAVDGILFMYRPFPAQSSRDFHWEGRVVVEQEQFLDLELLTRGTVWVVVSGYQLFLP